MEASLLCMSAFVLRWHWAWINNGFHAAVKALNVNLILMRHSLTFSGGLHFDVVRRKQGINLSNNVPAGPGLSRRVSRESHFDNTNPAVSLYKGGFYAANIFNAFPPDMIHKFVFSQVFTPHVTP